MVLLFPVMQVEYKLLRIELAIMKSLQTSHPVSSPHGMLSSVISCFSSLIVINVSLFALNAFGKYNIRFKINLAYFR